MIWQLTDEYRINVIPLNFVLERLTEVTDRNTGETKQKWKILGYYSGLESALAAVPDDIAQHPEVKDFEGFMARWQSLAGKLARSVGK